MKTQTVPSKRAADNSWTKDNPLRELEWFYNIYRDHMKHEGDLINQRSTWHCSSRAFCLQLLAQCKSDGLAFCLREERHAVLVHTLAIAERIGGTCIPIKFRFERTDRLSNRAKLSA